MPTYLPIGLGAGAVAALLFASATAGPGMGSVLLFFLSPLPTFLVGLGWGWLAAAASTLAGMIALAAFASLKAGVVFALGQGLPVAVLCYLVYLNRTTPAPDGSMHVEWYPLGRLLVVAAAMSGGLALLSLLQLGTDQETLRERLKPIVEMFVKQVPVLGDSKKLAEEDLARLTDMALYILPFASAFLWLAGLLVNFWLAARITLASGRLLRPWPDLATIQFPRGTPVLLAASLALTFLGGMPALAGTGFAGAFIAVYTLLGLAIIHFITRGSPWRSFILAVVYAALILINSWVAILIAMIGLAEPFSPLRRNLPPE